MKTIVVLEDCKSRIDWLTEEFRGEAKIVWRWRVSEFIEALKTEPDIAVVILDHDIPPPDSTEDDTVRTVACDADGKTGYDAAVEMPDVGAPVMIWSVNSVGRARMVAKLNDRGMPHVSLPHMQMNYPQMERFIRDRL